MCGDAVGRVGEPVPGIGFDLAILEYQQLKEEQRVRIASRDNLLYVTLVAIGAVCGAALQQGRPTILFGLPVLCVILGCTYVGNDRKVSQIGRYIRQSLSARLSPSAFPGAPFPGESFPWESVHRTGPGRRMHTVTQLGVSLLTFALPGVGALVANRATVLGSPVGFAVATAEVLAMSVLVQQILAGARSNRE